MRNKKALRQMKMETKHTNRRDAAKPGLKREAYIDMYIPQENRKSSNK